MRLPLLIASLAFSGSALFAQPQDDSLEGAEHERSVQIAAADGSLAKVIDAFLRAYSADSPAWRTDVQLGRATADSVPPDGYQKARSELSGWYYYRPKTSDMLDSDQRRAVLRDKRFAPFLAQMRAVADGKTAPLDPAIAAAGKAPAAVNAPAQIGRAELMSKLLAGRRGPPDTIYFDVTPEEIVLPGRLLVTTNATVTP